MARRAAATTAVCVLVVLACATTATADCEECWGKSSGPCRHDKDWSCFPYASGTTCPAGTTECKREFGSASLDAHAVVSHSAAHQRCTTRH